MTRPHDRFLERGEIKLSAVISIILLILGGLALKEYLPARIARAEIKDFMVEQTKFAAKAPIERLQKRILEKAAELDLPVEKKDIKIEKKNGRIKMQINYTVELRFPGYTYPYVVDERVNREVFDW